MCFNERILSPSSLSHPAGTSVAPLPVPIHTISALPKKINRNRFLRYSRCRIFRTVRAKNLARKNKRDVKSRTITRRLFFLPPRECFPRRARELNVICASRSRRRNRGCGSSSPAVFPILRTTRRKNGERLGPPRDH